MVVVYIAVCHGSQNSSKRSKLYLRNFFVCAKKISMTYTYVDEAESACQTITEPENCREIFQVENEIGHNRNGTELLPEFDGTVVKRVFSITPAIP